jgi:ankyrin repeat protein
MNRVDQELIEAAKENNLPEVNRLLIVGADVNTKDSGGRTPLHWASMNGHVQVFKELVEHGADTEVKSIFGWAALHYACYKGHLAVGNELLIRGADTEAKDGDGATPLHCACYNDDLAIVKALLSGGANILAANNQGHLPIHRAVSQGHSEVTKYLLEHFYATTRRLPLHALVEDLTWIGDPKRNDAPPLHSALHRYLLFTDDVVDICEHLVDQNPDSLASLDEDGSLPIHVACHRGATFKIVQFLVNRYKASVKSVTPQGDLPLFLACEIPEPSLDTIFFLMKLYPDLVYR